MASPPFIRAMHPKTEIRPEPVAVRKILNLGWIGQVKVHGHRAQIHIPADPKKQIVVYNRHGQPHRKKLPDALDKELRRIFGPHDDWTVLDAEWLKDKDKIYVFDLLKLNGQSLRTYTYKERWELLPRVYRSDNIETLPVLRSVDECMETLASTDDRVEGLCGVD